MAGPDRPATSEAGKISNFKRHWFVLAIEELEKKMEATKARLKELGEASEESWEPLKEGAENSWKTLSLAVRDTVAKFKH